MNTKRIEAHRALPHPSERPPPTTLGDVAVNIEPIVLIVAVLAAFALGASLGRRRAPDTKPLLLQEESAFPSAGHVLERVGEGLILLDGRFTPTFANQAAKDLLGLEEGHLPMRLPLREAAEAAEAASQGRTADAGRTVEIFYPSRHTIQIKATYLPETRESVVVLRDVTTEVRTQRLRTEFVAHASHELKTPVASLQTLAEAVAKALPDDMATAERFAGRMISEADRLSTLIADLLDLSRLEDPTKLSSEECDLSALVQDEVEHLGIPLMEAGLALSSELPDELSTVGDPRQLRLLIRNLLENAVQYTPSGGNIRVSLTSEADNVVLKVRDDGPGIPADALQKIFERFYRVDPGRSRDRGGTGLGLAIVKHIAERHGGDVCVNSELGEGSTFVVRLPHVRTEKEPI